MAKARDFVYAFGNVITLLNGVEVHGFSEGNDAITITPNTERVTKVVGSDGWCVFNLSEDNTAEVKIKLQPTSPYNAYLTSIFDRFVATKRIQDNQFLMTDLSGNDLWFSRNFVVKGYPESQRGVQNGDQVWTLLCSSLETTLAGEF